MFNAIHQTGLVKWCLYLYALCWRPESIQETMSITGSQITNVHMSPVEPWGDGGHCPGPVPPHVGGVFQEVWQLTRKI